MPFLQRKIFVSEDGLTHSLKLYSAALQEIIVAKNKK